VWVLTENCTIDRHAISPCWSGSQALLEHQFDLLLNAARRKLNVGIDLDAIALVEQFGEVGSRVFRARPRPIAEHGLHPIDWRAEPDRALIAKQVGGLLLEPA